MKRLLLLLMFCYVIITLNYAEMIDWWFLGFANTTLTGEHAKGMNANDDFKLNSLDGLQFGFTTMVELKNKVNLGANLRYVEKGWVTEDQKGLYTAKNNYLEVVFRGGYTLPKLRNMSFYPYLGLGFESLLNSESPNKYTQGSNSFVVGLDVNFIEKFMLCINYGIGLTDVQKGDDTKYNTYSFAMGRKF